MPDGIENTDKYYKNKKPGSAFAQSAADSVRKPRKTLPPGYSPVVTPNFNRDDVSTDKYYREGGSKGGAAGQTVPKLPFKAVDPAAKAGSLGVILIEIHDAKFLGEGIAAAKDAAKQGSKVEIAVTEKSLIARVGIALDGAVSREEITEDQRREIRVGVKKQGWQTASRAELPSTAPLDLDKVFGAPVALGTQEAATPEDPLDVDAFLAGGAKDDEDEKLAALTGGTADGGRPPAPAAVEPEDNDFAADSPAVGTTPAPETLDPPEEVTGPTPPDLSKLPQQPKTQMGIPGGVVDKVTDDL